MTSLLNVNAVRKYVCVLSVVMFVCSESKSNDTAVAVSDSPALTNSNSYNAVGLSDLFEKQQRLKKVNKFLEFQSKKEKDWKKVQVNGRKILLVDPSVTDETPERYHVELEVKEHGKSPSGNQDASSFEQEGWGYLSFYNKTHEKEPQAVKIAIPNNTPEAWFTERAPNLRRFQEDPEKEPAYERDYQRQSSSEVVEFVNRLLNNEKKKMELPVGLLKHYESSNSTAWKDSPAKLLENVIGLLDFAEANSDELKTLRLREMLIQKLSQISPLDQQKRPKLDDHKSDRITLINHPESSDALGPVIRMELRLWDGKRVTFFSEPIMRMYNVDLVVNGSDGKIQINFDKQKINTKKPFRGSIPLTKTVEQFLQEKRRLFAVEAKTSEPVDNPTPAAANGNGPNGETTTNILHTILLHIQELDKIKQVQKFVKQKNIEKQIDISSTKGKYGPKYIARLRESSKSDAPTKYKIEVKKQLFNEKMPGMFWVITITDGHDGKAVAKISHDLEDFDKLQLKPETADKNAYISFIENVCAIELDALETLRQKFYPLENKSEKRLLLAELSRLLKGDGIDQQKKLNAFTSYFEDVIARTYREEVDDAQKNGDKITVQTPRTKLGGIIEVELWRNGKNAHPKANGKTVENYVSYIRIVVPEANDKNMHIQWEWRRFRNGNPEKRDSFPLAKTRDQYLLDVVAQSKKPATADTIKQSDTIASDLSHSTSSVSPTALTNDKKEKTQSIEHPNASDTKTEAEGPEKITVSSEPKPKPGPFTEKPETIAAKIQKFLSSLNHTQSVGLILGGVALLTTVITAGVALVRRLFGGDTKESNPKKSNSGKKFASKQRPSETSAVSDDSVTNGKTTSVGNLAKTAGTSNNKPAPISSSVGADVEEAGSEIENGAEGSENKETKTSHVSFVTIWIVCGALVVTILTLVFTIFCRAKDAINDLAKAKQKNANDHVSPCLISDTDRESRRRPVLSPKEQSLSLSPRLTVLSLYSDKPPALSLREERPTVASSREERPTMASSREERAQERAPALPSINANSKNESRNLLKESDRVSDQSESGASSQSKDFAPQYTANFGTIIFENID